MIMMDDNASLTKFVCMGVWADCHLGGEDGLLKTFLCFIFYFNGHRIMQKGFLHKHAISSAPVDLEL